ncbi:MAG: DUF881 domain-containing protein [Clostridia bacterium]|nr:DUF881 domain-containing protein [Clostridia bacterium]
MNKNKVGISIVFGIISIFIVAIMSIQFKTINQTDITTLESMQEEELRNEILQLKEKNAEIENKINENEEKIKEYEETLNNNQKASELLDSELREYEELIGLTDVSGEGIILTLTDTDIRSYRPSNLIDFVNELKYAGATAISINDNRIINTTEIVEISKKYILLNGDQRISSPYVIKAIGDKQKMLETLNLKDEGYIDLYKSAEYDIKLEENSNITIYKYNKDINLEYIKEGEDN